KHFPFYQASDERWKNSVRHNLSINPHFRKESKAPQGAGHLWVVMDNNNKAKNSWKEERIQNFLAAQVSAAEAAESAASAAAAPAPVPAPAPAPEPSAACVASPPSPVRPATPPSPVTAGAKSYSQLNTVSTPAPHAYLCDHSAVTLNPVPLQWWSERVSLERSAEEILSGVKREVGVEFLTPMDLDGDLDTDVMKLDMKDEKGFLYGDLTTEQVIAESGLQDELAGLYLLNDMTSSITGDSLFPDDLNFAGLELPLSG
ncbi:Forkhead transcription factor HCM1, partial [Frankliniella fusca]